MGIKQDMTRWVGLEGCWCKHKKIKTCSRRERANSSLPIRHSPFCGMSVLWRMLPSCMLCTFFVHMGIFLPEMLMVHAVVAPWRFLDQNLLLAILPLAPSFQMRLCSSLPCDPYLETLSFQHYLGCLVSMWTQLYALCPKKSCVSQWTLAHSCFGFWLWWRHFPVFRLRAWISYQSLVRRCSFIYSNG